LHDSATGGVGVYSLFFKGERKMSEDLRRLKEKYEDLLLGIKGVTGVGVNGSIIVYVERLTPELNAVVPKSLDGVQVHVKESGKIRLLSFMPMDAIYGDRVGRLRPAPGGVSIGHPAGTAGTLTCAVIDSKTLEVIGGLTNNHVAALDWGQLHEGKIGDPILQPGPYDGGVVETDEIGTLLRYIPVVEAEDNVIDAAVFESEQLKREVLEVGKPSFTVEPRVGMSVIKSGRTSGINYGKITDVNATITVEGGEGWGSCIFRNQIIMEPGLLLPGDSGSWIGNIDNFNTLGLGFAGSDTLAVANKALTVESLLEVKIIQPVDPVKLSYVGLGWAGIFGVSILSMKGGKKHEL
jgi:hypothetical protein